MRELRFRLRLLGILVPAAAGLLLFAGQDTLELWGEVGELRRTEHQVESVRRAAALVHELQIERGLSAGFIAAGGAHRRAELARQRQATDAAIAGVAGLRGDATLGELERAVAAAWSGGGVLDAMRRRVDDRQVAGPESFAFYSRAIERLLAISGAAARLAPEPEVARRVVALRAFTAAKEQVGRERATLNAAFAGGTMEEEQHQRLLGILAAQATYLDEFAAYASEAARSAFARVVQGADVSEALALRERALALGRGVPLGVDAGRWFAAVTGKIEKMRTVETQLAGEAGAAIAAAVAAARRGLTWHVVLFVLAFGLAVALGLGQARRLLVQLGGDPGYAALVVRRLAQGQLDQEITVVDGDRSSLVAEVKNTQVTLAQMVGRIHEATESVAAAAREIAAGSADLRGRTDEQAASLGETATSMAKLTGAVRQNAESAGTVNQLAIAAAETAVRGGQAVRDVVTTMDAIAASSRRIGEIMGVIDEIAFQTNILALNAAVEAARAGAEGQTFTVVAGEVRELARRTATAAREVKTLIGEAAEQVATGSSVAAAAGDRIDGLVAAVRHITELMGRIAGASRDQTAGIERVNQAVGRMDEGTRQNAAIVVQTTSAATSMEEQSRELRDAVARFKLAA